MHTHIHTRVSACMRAHTQVWLLWNIRNAVMLSLGLRVGTCARDA